jgi:hypothetical protein
VYKVLSADVIKPEFIKSFWQKVSITEDSDDCWEWLSAKNSKGYGRVKIEEEVTKPIV